MSKTLAAVAFGILTFPLIALQGVTKGGQQAQPSGRASHDHLVATCAEVPPGEKRPDFGCFIIATEKGLQFTQPTVYWHLRTFPSRAAAEAAKAATGIVVEEDGRVWLSEFGPRDSTLRGGESVAVIGPLELPRAKTYDAVLSYAVMRPGDRSLVHTHPGPEGWYMLAGEQCLETQAGTKKAATGESLTVPPNVPMELSIVGTTIRRSLVLIIHDSAQTAIIPSDWKPSGACYENQSSAPAHSLILQEDDGERRVGRPPETDFHFTIKVDGQNGNAQDSTVATTILAPADSIPFHMHHNAEEVVILKEGGATVTVGNKRAVAGPRSIAFIPRDTWVSIVNTSTHPVRVFGMFTRQGFESYLRAISVREGATGTPINPAEREQLRAMGHATYWDTSKGPTPPVSENARNPAAPQPLVLQEGDGEHLLRRYTEQTRAAAPGSIPEFIIKIDKKNGGAEDFVAVTEILKPGAIIPFHMHHNAEEILILEEGGATVTVGDKRALAGPGSIVFIPRETWISVSNTANHLIPLYALFSRPGFEDYLRARSVHLGEPVTPLTSEERHKAEEQGHAMFWNTSKGPYPPGVAHP